MDTAIVVSSAAIHAVYQASDEAADVADVTQTFLPKADEEALTR